jgi:transposase InsO family protein
MLPNGFLTVPHFCRADIRVKSWKIKKQGGFSMEKANYDKKAEEAAEKRIEIISPLLDRGLDKGKFQQLVVSQCQKHGISERTVKRYLESYRKDGYKGLYPMKRANRAGDGAITGQIVDMAVMLRREVPSRSIETIIRILEMEEVVAPGELKRTTLQDNLAKRGYSARQMKMYSSNPGGAARRFSKKRRMQLVQSDIKYGPYLPMGPGGKKQQAYLVTVMDDATRYILHAQFYPVLDQTIVQESLRMAILKYGLMESVFFDNGAQYRTKWMKRACGKLGIRLLYAKPRSPEATGKPEKFNKYVENFLAEAALEKPKTLKELNELFDVWLTEFYQNKPHSALGGKTPQAVFNADPACLRFVSPETVADAFLHYEERKVDKTGCISFAGKKYEAGLKYIGCTVGVVYDPLDISEITVEHQGNKPFTAKELTIGANTGKRPQMPDTLDTSKPESSRLLTGAKKANEKRKASRKMILSFRKPETAGGDEIV